MFYKSRMIKNYYRKSKSHEIKHFPKYKHSKLLLIYDLFEDRTNLKKMRIQNESTEERTPTKMEQLLKVSLLLLPSE